MIRDAVPSDYAAVAEMFGELGVDDAVPSEAEWIVDSMPRTVVADRGGDVVGYASFRNGHVHNLVVAPRARGEHVASTLMREVGMRMRAAGVATWTLNVKADNPPAIRLYEHLGMRPSHRARSMRVPWAIVDTLPDDPIATTATTITAADDAELEHAFQITAGRLSAMRARPVACCSSCATRPTHRSESPASIRLAPARFHFRSRAPPCCAGCSKPCRRTRRHIRRSTS